MTIPAAIADDGLEAINVACELALEAHAISDSYVLNALNPLKTHSAFNCVLRARRSRRR